MRVVVMVMDRVWILRRWSFWRAFWSWLKILLRWCFEGVPPTFHPSPWLLVRACVCVCMLLDVSDRENGGFTQATLDCAIGGAWGWFLINEAIIRKYLIYVVYEQQQQKPTTRLYVDRLTKPTEIRHPQNNNPEMLPSANTLTRIFCRRGPPLMLERFPSSADRHPKQMKLLPPGTQNCWLGSLPPTS